MRKILLTCVVVLSASTANAADERSLTQEPGRPQAFETRPADNASAAVKPAEAKAPEIKAAESAPAESKPSEAKKRPAAAAKRRETDEEKARRIAKRYGVTW